MATRDLMTTAEAAAYLRIGNKKMAKLLREGVLTWEPDPLDGRRRLVRRADVEALAARSTKKQAQAA
jgi:excisionase family DNA binding protein